MAQHISGALLFVNQLAASCAAASHHLVKTYILKMCVLGEGGGEGDTEEVLKSIHNFYSTGISPGRAIPYQGYFTFCNSQVQPMSLVTLKLLR